MVDTVPWKSRIVAEADVDPGTLTPHPKNWRLHSDLQAAALRGVLNDVGWVQRVLVNQRTGHLLDGHLRVAQALQHGDTTIPVCYVDLSEAEEALVLATLDPFLGCAPSVIAAEQRQRRLYGLELSPEYVAVCLQRWADLTGRTPQRSS